jgi:hypothetical protein
MNGMTRKQFRRQRAKMPTPCECVQCCEGEHAGYCAECAGWGDVDGEECMHCACSGICPVCNGAAAKGGNLPERL